MSLSLRDHRADALYAQLREPGSRVLTTADVYAALRERWSNDAIGEALADLCARGVVAEGPYGELIVGPDAHRSAA